ncbi:DUF998 domain-containing protein [Poseidonocella sedimentorum]|uniref:DUF998 domain-containing protein n=1 Tax=Poseidonocella sedimentorum TaxID=871652 RepID=A0A1I6CWX2_9RHOB|nr:DUF998 domain-containing protein [Poseidonocella sedimentorum]SFQ97577.1 Protein of unknown function [Poseidonocella sedimentorum]
MRPDHWVKTRPRGLVVLPILSGLWLAIGVGILGALTPGYSHITQFMSALGADGAPFAAWTNYAVFIPAEILLLAFLALLRASCEDSKATRVALICLFSYAALLIAAAVLPCDAGCQSAGEGASNTNAHIAHMAIAATAYPLALIGLVTLGLSAPKASPLRRVALPAALVGVGLFVAIAVFEDAQGLVQRLLETWIYLHFILIGKVAASSVSSPPE